MKKSRRTMKMLVATLLFAALFAPKTTTACVDPDTTIVNVIVNYDTTTAPLITEVEIRLTNLRLMNEAPNKVCACALTKWSKLFENLDYIAFVYEGTNNPYDGFAAFNSSASSSTAWDNSTTSGDWSGYIATVVNDGLSASEAVDLVIRASTPAGTQYTLQGNDTLKQLSLVEAVNAESLGTDEWSPTADDLVNAHRGIQKVSSATNISYKAMPSTYFENLDTAITNNIPVSARPIDLGLNSVNVSPNPFNDKLSIQLDLVRPTELTITLFSLNGQEVIGQEKQTFSAGSTNVDLITSAADLQKGIYFIRISSEQYGSLFKQVVHQ